MQAAKGSARTPLRPKCLSTLWPYGHTFCISDCTPILYFCRHSLLRYPEQSKQAFGEKHGCFELPSEDKAPSKHIQCKDILPIIYSDQDTNRDAMKDPNPLVHPDSTSLVRYCLGTGLQMRDSNKGSHKTISCSYHDVNNSEDGKMMKTMTQVHLTALLDI